MLDFFKVIFIFLRKKADFRAIFRHGQRSFAEPGPTPSAWIILVGIHQCQRQYQTYARSKLDDLFIQII